MAEQARKFFRKRFKTENPVTLLIKLIPNSESSNAVNVYTIEPILLYLVWRK